MPPRSQFDRLALPHQDAAYNLAYWLLRSRSDAEDAVQEGYLRAFRAFESFRGEDVRPWLFAIVRNAAYRILNTRRRAANVVSLDSALSDDDDGPAPEVASEAPSAEAMLIGQEERDLVRAALEDLPTALREVVVLREIEGMSYREIAEISGTVIGTVMSRLSRGRQLLRQSLARRMDEDRQHAL